MKSFKESLDAWGDGVDEASPLVDARLPDGTRLNAVIKPLALDGALVSIRRFAARPLFPEDVVARRAATPQMMEFLATCVQARMTNAGLWMACAGLTLATHEGRDITFAFQNEMSVRPWLLLQGVTIDERQERASVYQ